MAITAFALAPLAEAPVRLGGGGAGGVLPLAGLGHFGDGGNLDPMGGVAFALATGAEAFCLGCGGVQSL